MTSESSSASSVPISTSNESLIPSKSIEPKFEVNVNWSSLFAPTSSTDSSSNANNTGFSLNSMFGNKIKSVSVEELFKKQQSDATVGQDNKSASCIPEFSNIPVPAIKKTHNYANLFGDLNRITPTTATRFGLLLSQKEDMLQEWRVERIELKEDFKKKLAEGKRRNRRGNKPPMV